MNSQVAAGKVEQLQPNLEYGTITSCSDGGGFAVQLSFGTVQAEKAVSCLLEPINKDLVLVSVDISGACYILSVLKRCSGDEPHHLRLPGDCILESRSGSLDIRAAQGLQFSAADTVEVTGDRIRVCARSGEALISTLSLLGKALHVRMQRITTVAKTIEQTLKRLTQRMENCDRFVEDHEEVQTGSTRYLVEDTLSTHAGNTINISEELHTMHAEQIHMS
jgi:hypothetical protein